MYRIIFRHFPKRGKVRDFIRAWQKNSDIIQTYPGALGSKLFHSHDDPQVYYAIADWQSEQERALAMESIEKRNDAQEILHGHEQHLIDGRGEIVAHLELISESNPPEK